MLLHPLLEAHARWEPVLRVAGVHAGKYPCGISGRVRVHYLVYFETTDNVESAITREKQLKKWKRDYKIRLIEETNPLWRDLYLDLAW